MNKSMVSTASDIDTIDITGLRISLRDDRSSLEQLFLKNGKSARLLSLHSNLIDNYLRQVWESLEMPDNVALVGVGGYGRGELYPRSDIDLLILLHAEPDEALQQKLQALVGQLWDIGLEVGHSIRTIAQCLKESADITVQTNLLEARLLFGDARLFRELENVLNSLASPNSRRASSRLVCYLAMPGCSGNWKTCCTNTSTRANSLPPK